MNAGSKTALAPIAVFAYRRPQQLQRSLKSLARCPEFARSQVHIFVDGPKGEAEAPAVAETLAVARSFSALNISIVAQPRNLGLAASIIAGVTRLCDAHDRVIVIEDDLVVQPAALAWLNQGLDAYAHDPRVMQIGAYQYRAPEFEERPHGTFQRFATTWGWATWKRAWDLFDPDATGWETVQSSAAARRDFDAGGSYPFSDMLVRQMAGRLDSWGIRWSWTLHRHGGLTLLPPRSLVANEGFRSSATHNTVGALKRFTQGPAPVLWNADRPPSLPDRVAVDEWEQAVFRRALLRTGAQRNHRIKQALAGLGLRRFA